MLTKMNPVESGYFWGESWYFNEKSLKMENLIYMIVSYLYIAILLLFKSIRYYLLNKGVGMVRAIFGPVQDSAVFVIFCLNMLCLSKIWCFKSICLVFYISGLKVQKTTKNRRFLEKINIFYIAMSQYILLAPYVHIKQTAFVF